MCSYLALTLLTLQVLSSEGLFQIPKENTTFNNYGDTGKPLFLTPYIERGKIEEARNLARVSLPDDFNIESYAGFFTVDKKYNSNHFVWYFPAEDKSKSLNITIVWLQGGPGASTFFGLFDEIGPIYMENNTLLRRKSNQYWSEYFNVIHIDNPVGTGFSFTDDELGYMTNQTQIGEQLYETLTQVYKLFPELMGQPLIISGESYGGKYAPSLAYMIHKHNPTAETRGKPCLPLKGVTIGNGFSDPINQLDYAEYLYQLGLISADIRKHVNQSAEGIKKLIKEGRFAEASTAWNVMMTHDIQENMGQVSIYNYVHNTDLICSFCYYMNTEQMRKAIHVGDQTFNSINDKVYALLANDLMKSVAPWLSELLDHYKVWFYNGQQDIIVAYPLTENFLRKLDWSGQNEYKKAKRQQVYYSQEDQVTLIAFTKTAGNLTESMIRGGGHMIPGDRPEWMMHLLQKWCHDTNI